MKLNDLKFSGTLIGPQEDCSCGIVEILESRSQRRSQRTKKIENKSHATGIAILLFSITIEIVYIQSHFTPDVEDNAKRKSNQAYSTVPHTRHSKSMDHLVCEGSNASDRSLMIQFSYPPANYYNPRIRRLSNPRRPLETESYPSNGYAVYPYASNQSYCNTLPLAGSKKSDR